MTSSSEAVRIVLRVCMGLKKGESLLVVFDQNKKKIASLFFSEGKKITSKAKKIEAPVAEVNSQEPPKYITEEILKYDVVVIATTKSMSHTLARKTACEKGARIASMPGITEEMMQRAIAVDYEALFRRTKKLREQIGKAKTVRVTTKRGTDISFGVAKDRLHGGSGFYTKKSRWGNLPIGEMCLSPLEGTSNGVFIVDASMAGTRDVKIKTPIKITVKNGIAVKMEGGKEAEELKQVLKNVKDKNVYNIAELGIGTNDKAKITGKVLEDEKVLGTAHIALGDNFSLGGKVKAGAHLDGVFLKPTIYAGSKKIMENGIILG